jgi:hypothetical protein
VSFAILAAVFVLFLVGINRASDPSQETSLQRQSFMNRPEDVVPLYDVNDTAIVTLKVNQKSGPIILKEITLFGEVKVDSLTDSCDIQVVQDVLQTGETVDSCWSVKTRLLNKTTDTATFEFVRGLDTYGCCPYCWHMYQSEIYDEYVAALTAS